MDEQQPRVASADSARERLIFLSDGVFAIAITVLVLEITIPVLPRAFAFQEAKLPGVLFGQLPQIVTYALCFIIVGAYWMTHQRIFDYFIRVNSMLIWLNIMFLVSVAFLPVPTNVLGRYGDHGAAVRFYALSLMVARVVIIVRGGMPQAVTGWWTHVSMPRSFGTT